MKITNVRTYIVSMPLRRRHAWAGNTARSLGRHLIVKVETDEGIHGWGESPAIPTWGGPHGRYYGESPDSAKLIIDSLLAPSLMGQDPREVAIVHSVMQRIIKGNPYAKVGIDIACHDIAGKAAGVPVSTLLGGRFREEVELSQSLGLLPIEECVSESIAAVSEGVTNIKIKTGYSPERDIEVVRQIREAVGDSIDLRTDANEGYASRGEALFATLRQEEYGVKFTEQPMEGTANLAFLAQRVSAPIMADESAWTEHDLLELDRAGAASYFSCYSAKPGGLYRARRQGELGESLSMSCDVGGSVELGIGSAANLHLAASLRNAHLASVIPVNRIAGHSGNEVAGVYYMDDIIAEPHRIQNGRIRVPEGPGLGVTVDEEKLEHHAED